MNQLTSAGQNAVNSLSQRYGVSQDAVLHLLYAVNNGNGSMAQFNHPELGGGGQWMQGGMVMVGDMFNSNLQGLVTNLCNELSNLLARQQVLKPLTQEQCWYPLEFGVPSSSGGQNSMRYAYFANVCRLVIEDQGNVSVYNTLDHQIGGVSQQQSGSQSLSFSSQYGYVNLMDLPLMSVNGKAPQPVAPPMMQPVAQPPQQNPMPVQPAPSNTAPVMPNNEIFAAIEQLANLYSQNVLTQAEFEQKKAELLSRL